MRPNNNNNNNNNNNINNNINNSSNNNNNSNNLIIFAATRSKTKVTAPITFLYTPKSTGPYPIKKLPSRIWLYAGIDQ